MSSTVLVDYMDPAGSLKILLEYTLVAVDFPYNEFLECFLQWEYIGLFHEPHHRWYNLSPAKQKSVDNLVGSLSSVSVKISSCLASNLFYANKASCDDSSIKLFFMGWWVLSRRMA